MSDLDFLGEFEHIVLLALLRLKDQAYGVTVRQEIEFRTKRDVSIGAVYATLGRLEAKGYVKSRRGDPTRAVRPFDERLVAEWMRSIPGDCVSFFGTASNDFPLLRAPCSSQAHMNCVG